MAQGELSCFFVLNSALKSVKIHLHVKSRFFKKDIGEDQRA